MADVDVFGCYAIHYLKGRHKLLLGLKDELIII